MSWVTSCAAGGRLPRAPSAPNTQPWLVCDTSRDAAAVHWSRPRAAGRRSDPARPVSSPSAFVETASSWPPTRSRGTARGGGRETGTASARLVRPIPLPDGFWCPPWSHRRCAAAAAYRASGCPRKRSRVPDARRGSPPAAGCSAPGRPLYTRADRWLFGTPALARQLRTWLRPLAPPCTVRLDVLTDRALALSGRGRRLGAAISPRAVPIGGVSACPALLAACHRCSLRRQPVACSRYTALHVEDLSARRSLRGMDPADRARPCVHPLEPAARTAPRTAQD